MIEITSGIHPSNWTIKKIHTDNVTSYSTRKHMIPLITGQTPKAIALKTKPLWQEGLPSIMTHTCINIADPSSAPKKYQTKFVMHWY